VFDVRKIMAEPRYADDCAKLWLNNYVGEDSPKLEEMYKKIGCRKSRTSYDDLVVFDPR
jgi:hypothetical protein